MTCTIRTGNGYSCSTKRRAVTGVVRFLVEDTPYFVAVTEFCYDRFTVLSDHVWYLKFASTNEAPVNSVTFRGTQLRKNLKFFWGWSSSEWANNVLYKLYFNVPLFRKKNIAKVPANPIKFTSFEHCKKRIECLINYLMLSVERLLFNYRSSVKILLFYRGIYKVTINWLQGVRKIRQKTPGGDSMG